MFEQIIPNGGEWNLTTPDWVVLQLSEGIAYAFDRKGSKELPLGGVIVCPPKSEITLTASVLGRAVFRGMAMRVSSLTGFLTALERQCLETEVARQCAPFLSLPAEHPLARRVTQFFAQEQTPTLSNRLVRARRLRNGWAAVARGAEQGQGEREKPAGRQGAAAAVHQPDPGIGAYRTCRWRNWPNCCTAANVMPAGCFERNGEPGFLPMSRKFG